MQTTIDVEHTPFFVKFTALGPTEALDPIAAELAEASIAFERTGSVLTIDLHAQGEGSDAIQKGLWSGRW